MEKMKNKFGNIKSKTGRALLTLAVFFVFALLIKEKELSAGILQSALETLYRSLIPATFPFMVLSNIILRSGAGEMIGKRFSFLSKLFDIPASGVSIFLISLISGFPLGAVLSRELYDKGEATRDECERIAAFCNIPSPAFIMSVFSGMMKNVRAGIILYLVNILFSVLYGIILGRISGKSSGKKNKTTKRSAGTVSKRSVEISDVICSSISSAGEKCLVIYSFVLFFSLVSSLISKAFSLSRTASLLFSGILEMASGSTLIGVLPEKLRFFVGSGIISFGGISVFMQIKSALGTNFSARKYLLGRVLAFLTVPALSYLIYIL